MAPEPQPRSRASLDFRAETRVGVGCPAAGDGVMGSMSKGENTCCTRALHIVTVATDRGRLLAPFPPFRGGNQQICVTGAPRSTARLEPRLRAPQRDGDPSSPCRPGGWGLGVGVDPDHIASVASPSMGAKGTVSSTVWLAWRPASRLIAAGSRTPREFPQRRSGGRCGASARCSLSVPGQTAQVSRRAQAAGGLMGLDSAAAPPGIPSVCWEAGR